MEEEEVATSLGRRAGSAVLFEEEVRRRVADGHTDLVLDLVGVLGALSAPGLLNYVRREVRPHRLRTLFFVQAPLDRAVLTVESGELPALVCMAVDMGADVPRLACGVTPMFVRAAAVVDDVATLCAAVVRLATTARDLVAEEELFAKLAARMRPNAYVVHVVDVVRACDVYDDRIAAVVTKCARFLVSEFTRVQHLDKEPHLKAALDFLTTCAARNDYWRTVLVPHVAAMARHGWPSAFVPLLTAMLSDPSVELLLTLEKSHRLAHLIRRAHDAVVEHPAWKVVGNLLQRHWPGRVAEVLNAPDAPTRDPTQVCTCAITLDVIMHPVVASDGHTYERDALLRHMCQNGRFSPLTKETLHFALYENRAVV